MVPEFDAHKVDFRGAGAAQFGIYRDAEQRSLAEFERWESATR
jgi:hypothetical protein